MLESSASHVTRHTSHVAYSCHCERSEAIRRSRPERSRRISKLPTTRITNHGVVVSVNISSKAGVPKKPVDHVMVLPDHGLEGDAHAGGWHRQVSLLAQESIDKMRQRGLNVSPGDFAENITTKGINLSSLPIGSQLKLGGGVLIEISQIGKVCHERCAIYYQAGDCIMPKEGIFAKVLKGGEVKAGNKIVVEERKK